MAVKGMYFLDGGVLTLDKSLVTYKQGFGESLDIPVVPVLIDTDDGYVLFDTGVDPEGLINPDETWGEKQAAFRHFTEENDIRNQLQKVGVSPKDVKYVVNSHFHWDHTGGNRFFDQSTILIQKSEYRFAYYPDWFVENIYLKHQFDYPLNYKLIEGDYEVVEGVYITTSPGHSPGHQSLVVHLPNQCAVLVGDAVYAKENLEKNIPPGNPWSLPRAIESINKLQNIAIRENGHLYITHDPYFWEDYKRAPYFYK
ncbi:N-acyl homoserine lactonase family protein [Psychrobacillus sp. OK032]|uniref:N-acyl homoserine lactonase family protein n=1 Tax=Psychrobacillus sp. OK032 TaxID=1884358 RepID=UPI0008B52434|nr:N-acyl homoserine lactonase family protein [Psychrobacillus sp. OK032]SER82555.1 Glyoxylase, beta-lactamase superfamily II [Psychrobacillus sp. OK032]